MTQDERKDERIRFLEEELRAKPDQHFKNGIYCDRCGRRFIDHLEKPKKSSFRNVAEGLALGTLLLIFLFIAIVIIALVTR